jgi:hypothetical protein
MARPTKLTKELVDKAAKYIGETMMGGLYAGDLPMVAGLAIYLGVSRDSIYEWSKKRDKYTELERTFSDIVEDILTWQEYKLAGKSLKGEYNPTIARLLLNSKHGYVESTKTDVTSDGEKLANPFASLTVDELKKLAKRK